MRALRGPYASAAVAILILAILIVASSVTMHLFVTSEQEARTIEQVQASETALLADQLDEETGIRGFFATHDAQYLQPYRAALPRFQTDARSLHAQLRDLHAENLDRLATQLEALNAQWRVEVADSTLRQPRAVAITHMLTGKMYVDRFRATHRQLMEGLDALLAERQAGQTAVLRRARIITLSLIVLTAIAIVAASARASATENRLRREREALHIDRRRARQFTAIVQTIPQVVWTADAQGKLQYVNDRWYEFSVAPHGTPPLDPHLIADRIHPADKPLAAAQWQRCLVDATPLDMEYRLLGGDGRYRWFRVRAVPELDDAGKPVQWFGTYADVEEHHRELAETQRVANVLQNALMPKHLPAAHAVEFDATYVAAEDVAHVGGDWYDVLDRGDGTFLFSIGDVTGHGLSAAIDMGKARQAIVSLAALFNDPAALLEHANDTLRLQTETLVSALVGIYNSNSGEIAVSSAGHPPALLVRAHSHRALASSGPALGTFERLGLETTRDRLEVGDLFVCYTDGIIEQTRDVLTGEAHLLEAVSAVRMEGSRAPAREIRRRMLGGKRGRDDVAILTISRTEPAGEIAL